jgi:hypothetical protein
MTTLAPTDHDFSFDKVRPDDLKLRINPFGSESNTFVSKTLYILCIKVKIRTAFLYNNSPLPVISEGWHLTHSGKHLHGRMYRFNM